MARREKGRVNALKKKFPPHLGPLGYFGTEREWAEERDKKDIATPAHFWDSRTSNYTLARIPQDKTEKRHVPLDMADVVNELASYNERMAEGSWNPPPGEDLLTSIRKGTWRTHPGSWISCWIHKGRTGVY